jgi:hypothetical protein
MVTLPLATYRVMAGTAQQSAALVRGHVIVPAIRGCATVMDVVFGDDEDDIDQGVEDGEASRPGSPNEVRQRRLS